MKLLHIDSSVLGPHSVSRQVSAAIVDRLRKSTPGLEVSYRDLTLTPLAHLSGPHLAAGQGAAPEAFAAAGHRSRSGRAGRVSGRRHRRARRTHVQFYDPKPAQGLDRPHPGGGQNVQIQRAGCRRVWPATSALSSRSHAADFTAPGTPAAVGEHLETYLRWVFGFIGVTNPEFISADGIQVGPEHREKAVAGALKAASNLDAA